MRAKKDPPGLGLRLKAAERLGEVLKGANFAPFSVAEIADGRDRALANRLVTTALRRHGQLNLVLARSLERGVPKRSGLFEPILRIALAQLLFLPDLGDHSALFLAVEGLKLDTRSAHLAKLANAVLRRAQAEAAEWRLLLPETLFPTALAESWATAYGDDALPRLADALIAGAPLDVTLRDDDPDLPTALNAVSVLADTWRIPDRDRPVDALPGFAEGRFWVQDAAASLPARLLRLAAGARVLDLCAAPGGKTAQLVKAGYQVTALDNDPQRVERLAANLARLGYSAEIVTADGLIAEPEPVWDGILLDAPCSATGTFRRHPEVIWHRDAADIAGRVALQRAFLKRAAAGLKSNAVLLYCVCSLMPEEGEGQAAWIAEALPELVPDPIRPEELGAFGAAVTAEGHVRTVPGQPVAGDTWDGFFIARYRRR